MIKKVDPGIKQVSASKSQILLPPGFVTWSNFTLCTSVFVLCDMGLKSIFFLIGLQ